MHVAAGSKPRAAALWLAARHSCHIGGTAPDRPRDSLPRAVIRCLKRSSTWWRRRTAELGVQGEQGKEFAVDQGRRACGEDLQDIHRIPLLSREEELAVAQRAHAGDPLARDRLILSNWRYVASVARQYSGRGLLLADLINEGNVGLLEAARRFDPARGVRFITYADWWIRNAIAHALAQQAGATGLPVKQLGTLLKLAEAYRRYVQTTGAPPSDEELAEELGLEPEEVARLLGVRRRHLSLDAPLGEDGDASFLDLMRSATLPSTEKTALKAALAAEMEELLGQLPPREPQGQRLRFGFDEWPLTLQEVGRRLGLSRERVRQLEERAKARLRVKARRKALGDYLN